MVPVIGGGDGGGRWRYERGRGDECGAGCRSAVVRQCGGIPARVGGVKSG